MTKHITNQLEHPPMRVSPEDEDLAVRYNVRTMPKTKRRYAKVHINGIQYHAHRVVVTRMLGRELLTEEQVDHIDGDGLNNTRENLRLCNKAQNSRNRPPPVNNTSGYKGVTKCRQTGRWRAVITVNGKSIHLGRYNTTEAAAQAYNTAALKHFGEFAWLNEIPD